MFAVRAAIAMTVAGAALVPSAVARATSDDEAHVTILANQAAEVLGEERQLLDALRGDDGAAVTAPGPDQARLIEVDERGNELLIELIVEGVELTDAVTAVLARLPAPAQPDAGVIQPPPDVVYDAAIADLTRIAAAPGAVTPDGGNNRGSLGLLAVAAAALMALGLAALSSALRSKDDSLDDTALTDGLTGVGNRRRLDRDMAAEQARHTGQTAVIMVDVDHFAAINEQYGQQVGDDVLRRFSTALAGTVRQDDVVYRYGNEEFCVLLPGAEGGEATLVADRIVAAAHSIELPDDRHITVSVGVADGAPADVTGTLETADRALHAAKAGGDQLQHA
jgi:diguanylate cyclase (GGDEF)-like protein